MSTREDVVIFGAGGLGTLVQDILQQAGNCRPMAFLDSDPQRCGQELGGLPILGGFEQIEPLLRQGVTGVIVAIGDNVTRAAHAETLRAHGLHLISAIHPLASISPSAQLGEHLVVGPRVAVCVHARIAPHAVLLAGAISEHDTRLGVGVFLGPAVRLAGAVRVADFARLEIGATVIPGRRIGRGAHVRAGAVVIRDVPARAVASGIPAGAAAAC